MSLRPGTKLGPYEVLSQIGAGGMGEVYKARDTRLNRFVAIKVLPVHLAEQPELRERFKREAETIAKLNHPHICTLYDIGSQEVEVEESGVKSQESGEVQVPPSARDDSFAVTYGSAVLDCSDDLVPGASLRRCSGR